MGIFILKLAVASTAISFCSWLAGKKPELAGFLIALPLTSILALGFSFVEHQDHTKTVAFAKSIFIGVPVSLLFFIPFLLAPRFNFGFATSFTLGLSLVVAGYFLHKVIVTNFI